MGAIRDRAGNGTRSTDTSSELWMASRSRYTQVINRRGIVWDYLGDIINRYTNYLKSVFSSNPENKRAAKREEILVEIEKLEDIKNLNMLWYRPYRWNGLSSFLLEEYPGKYKEYPPLTKEQLKEFFMKSYELMDKADAPSTCPEGKPPSIHFLETFEKFCETYEKEEGEEDIDLSNNFLKGDECSDQQANLQTRAAITCLCNMMFNTASEFYNDGYIASWKGVFRDAAEYAECDKFRALETLFTKVAEHRSARKRISEYISCKTKRAAKIGKIGLTTTAIVGACYAGLLFTGLFDTFAKEAKNAGWNRTAAIFRHLDQAPKSFFRGSKKLQEKIKQPIKVTASARFDSPEPTPTKPSTKTPRPTPTPTIDYQKLLNSYSSKAVTYRAALAKEDTDIGKLTQQIQESYSGFRSLEPEFKSRNLDYTGIKKSLEGYLRTANDKSKTTSKLAGDIKSYQAAMSSFVKGKHSTAEWCKWLEAYEKKRDRLLKRIKDPAKTKAVKSGYDKFVDEYIKNN
ncbi:hypothetical protein KY337_04055 [Candidatus Woesearchaeota archaeon]|nr:hypothetical protein [Candidatus Woesearchaeota archaeon]